MSFIDRINNRELGGTVRGKINQVIDVLNNIEDFLPPGPPGLPGPQGVPGPGVQVLLNLIGFGTDIGDLPAFANNGDTFLIRTTDEEDGDPIAQVYIFGGGAWEEAFEFTVPVDFNLPNIVYVTTNGDDTNGGFASTDALRTIKKGLEVLTVVGQTQSDVSSAFANVPAVLKVFPGIYVEDGDMVVPPNCAIVSEGGQYVTEIHASTECREEYRNMLLLSSGSYVQGFTFRNQEIDDFDDPSGGFAIAFAPNAKIIRSPYIRDIGQVSNYSGNSVAAPLDPINNNPLVGPGGGCILADRAVLDQNSIFTYMLAFGATPRSTNGIGYVAKNGAGINGISSISVFQQCSFFALNGGQITLNNSGTQFGDASMKAVGSTLVVRPVSKAQDGNLQTLVGAANLIRDNKPAIINNMWNNLVTTYGAFINQPELEELVRRNAANFISSIEFDFRGGTESVTQSFVLSFFDFKADYLFDPVFLVAFIDSFQDMRDQIINITSGVTGAEEMVTDLVAVIVDTLNDYETLRFPFGSLVESLGHQFNNAGAGVNKNALPLNFGRPGRNPTVPFTIVEQALGRVRFSGADELNNQFFGGGTIINGITGRIEGRPFDSAVRQIARRLSNSRGFI